MLKSFFQGSAGDITPRASATSGTSAEPNPFDSLPAGATPAPPHQRKPSGSSMLASGSRTPTSKSYPLSPGASSSSSSPSPSSFFPPTTPGGDVTPGGPGGAGFILGAVPVTPGGRATTGKHLSRRQSGWVVARRGADCDPLSCASGHQG